MKRSCSAGEQPAKGYPVRLIADDEAKARSFRRVLDRGSGADQREAALTLGRRFVVYYCSAVYRYLIARPPLPFCSSSTHFSSQSWTNM